MTNFTFQWTEQLKIFEGLVLTAYADIAGNATIGYGHKILPSENLTTITIEQANTILNNDISGHSDFVNSLNIASNQGEFDALVDFAYNLGNTALQESTLVKVIKDNTNHTDTGFCFLEWCHSSGIVNRDLLYRRGMETLRFYGSI